MPMISLQFGAWAGAGMASQNQSTAGRMERMGLPLLAPEQAIQRLSLSMTALMLPWSIPQLQPETIVTQLVAPQAITACSVHSVTALEMSVEAAAPCSTQAFFADTASPAVAAVVDIRWRTFLTSISPLDASSTFFSAFKREGAGLEISGQHDTVEGLCQGTLVLPQAEVDTRTAASKEAVTMKADGTVAEEAEVFQEVRQQVEAAIAVITGVFEVEADTAAITGAFVVQKNLNSRSDNHDNAGLKRLSPPIQQTSEETTQLTSVRLKKTELQSADRGE
jgi:hypothetical protein